MFETRADFDKELLKNVSYYVACQFKGVGYYHKIPGPTLEAVREEAKKQGGIWMLYAVCPYMTYEHNVHVGNYPESTYTKFRD